MSFGFFAVQDRWSTENGQTVRELLEVELFDVSPVTFPAYPQTSVGVRSAEEVYREYISSSMQGQPEEERQEDNWQGRLSILRKRLELLEKAI